jgi:hypothetical protein
MAGIHTNKPLMGNNRNTYKQKPSPQKMAMKKKIFLGGQFLGDTLMELRKMRSKRRRQVQFRSNDNCVEGLVLAMVVRRYAKHN